MHAFSLTTAATMHAVIMVLPLSFFISMTTCITNDIGLQCKTYINCRGSAFTFSLLVPNNFVKTMCNSKFTFNFNIL